jgi:hypothetical protein
MKHLIESASRIAENISQVSTMENKGIPEYSVSQLGPRFNNLSQGANEALTAVRNMADILCNLVHCKIDLRMISSISSHNKYLLDQDSPTIELLAIIDQSDDVARNVKFGISHYVAPRKSYIISEAFHTASIPTGLLIPKLPDYVSYDVTLHRKYSNLTVLNTELYKGQLHVLVKYQPTMVKDSQSNSKIAVIFHNDVFASLTFTLNKDKLVVEKQIKLSLQGCKIVIQHKRN